MNKPFLSGMGISRALRALAAFAVLFLAVGISQSYAQSNALAASQTVLTNKQVVQAQAPAGTNFLSGTAASIQLKTEAAALEALSPQTPAEEAENAAKISYYTLVAKIISGGSGVGDAFNNSARDLNSILNRYESSVAPSFGALRQSTLSLVSQ